MAHMGGTISAGMLISRSASTSPTTGLPPPLRGASLSSVSAIVDEEAEARARVAR